MAEVKILSAGEEILTTAKYVEKLDNGTLIPGRKYQTSDGDAKDIHFNNEGTDFESDNVHDALIEAGTSGGEGIPEAPQDDETYGRKNNAWVTITGGGGGTQAEIVIELGEGF